ncbi:MAG: ferritin [Methanobacterium sp.]|jgi:ferritin|nr:ferritin [Methanobacterium sp.]
MLDKEMEAAINKQLNAEIYSSYLYLSMEAYFETIDLSGFARWMRAQAKEELDHAMKFYDYLVTRGARVTLTAIETPPTEWESTLAVFDHVYKHEQLVTGLINKLVDLSISLSDHATNNFLQWYVAEQVEEEESASGALQKVKLAGEDSSALLMLDQELGQRVYNPPVKNE